MQSQALDWEAGKMRAFLRDLGGLSEQERTGERESKIRTAELGMGNKGYGEWGMRISGRGRGKHGPVKLARTSSTQREGSVCLCVAALRQVDYS